MARNQVKCVLASWEAMSKLSLKLSMGWGKRPRSKDAVVFAYMIAMAIRILIVDDSAIFRDGLRTILEDHVDWQVCGEAVDGVEAVKKNRLLAPHIIVMDLSMPYMTGIDAAAAILKESPKIPILLLTLYLTHHLTKQASDLGIRATLSKTEMRHLVGKIEGVLESEKLTEGDNRSRVHQS